MSKLHLLNRSVSTLVRILQFLIAALVLGIFSYYLAWLTRHHQPIPRWEKAVEGMSGIAVIYTAFAAILTCFLGGITFFAFLAVVLDVCFLGAFIAIAILTRDGHRSCGTRNNSPIGLGEHTSCQLQRAAFAVSIVAAFLFVISAGLQVALSRSHKREQRYGPSPANNYTSGTGNRKFWARKNRKNRDAELATVNANGHDNVNGGMDDPAMTGAVASNGYGGANDKYATRAGNTAPNPVGYTPQGTGYQSTGYAPQQTGVVGGGDGTSVPEMPGSTAQKPGGYVH